ncbi:MAG: pirin family protein [Myxococcota bacterium]|jgi:redox-sensitive bicupin YhaK (pirin superfamily)
MNAAAAALPAPAVADPVVKLTPIHGLHWPTLDPFLFCAHHDDAFPRGNGAFGPATTLAGRNIGQDFDGKDGWNMYHGERVPGFPSHPHRGFETVTLARKGYIDHSDSLGAAARFGQGDVQWLTAGKGIQHAEMFPLLADDQPNPGELFQIWLNLPAADKFAEPHFSMLWGPKIPKRTLTDAAGRSTEITVVAGKFNDLVPPAPPPKSYASRPDSDVAIWALKLQPGAEFRLPAAKVGSNRRLFFFAGASLQVGTRHVSGHHAIDLNPATDVVLTNGPAETEVLLLQGKPIGEPVAQYGPFVMNSRQEIQQAFSDYQRTRFGGWPWPDEAPVHGRQGRFARRPDGSVEEGA